MRFLIISVIIIGSLISESVAVKNCELLNEMNFLKI